MKSFIIKPIIRNCLKNRRSIVINIAGLSIGFAALLAIAFFIRKELNYNQFYDKIDNIYCVFTKDHTSKNKLGSNESVPALAKALRNEYPEVNDAALYYNSNLRMLVNYKDKKFFEQVQLADPDLFNIFSFPIIRGKIPKDRDEVNIVALSRKLAGKYFGDKDPIGKTLKIDDKYFCTVVAVFENIPKNSSIRFDFWMPIKVLESAYDKNVLKTWYNQSFSTYVLLNHHVSVKELNKKLYDRIQQSLPSSTARAQLYPFKDLYLKAWHHNRGINMMLMIAFVILTMVCINFINLHTAETFVNIRDFGVKKVNGAGNFAVIVQLVGEALIYCLISLVIAIGIVHSGQDYLFSLLGESAKDASILSWPTFGIVAFVAFLIAILSGLIPGLIIRSVSLSNSINNRVKEHTGTKKLSVVFTSLQFGMAIVLLICLLTTNKQLNYLHNKNLGFNKKQIAYIHIEGKLKEKKELLRDEIAKDPNVINATLASRSPIGIYWNGDGWDWEGKPKDFNPQITYIETDANFQKTFGMKMAEGNFFDSKKPGVVVNETFAHLISPNGDALNKLLVRKDLNVRVQVTGIIKDFNFKPLTHEIEPLMIIPPLGFDEMRYLFIKLSPQNMDKTLSSIKHIVTDLNPDFPFEYFFLDQDFDRQYKGEKRLRDQMMFFSIMALLISCMGLWGILMFMVKNRTKEIGIRKVNGAKVSEIMTMLNKDFIKWVVIAFVIACPIAWYAMHKWLENYAYKTTLSWWVFALAGMLALGIAILTVSFQSWKAATRNPVEALRYE